MCVGTHRSKAEKSADKENKGKMQLGSSWGLHGWMGTDDTEVTGRIQ